MVWLRKVEWVLVALGVYRLGIDSSAKDFLVVGESRKDKTNQ